MEACPIHPHVYASSKSLECVKNALSKTKVSAQGLLNLAHPMLCPGSKSQVILLVKHST